MSTQQNPEQELALNTNWVDASGMVLLFVITAFLGVHGIWRVLHGKIHSLSTSWIDILSALFLVYVGIGTKQKEIRIPCILLAFGSLSNALLRTLKAPIDLQIVNSIFVGWLDAVLFIAVACYVLIWFKRNTIFTQSKTAPNLAMHDPQS